MKKIINLILLGFLPLSIASAASVDLYYWPSAANAWVGWTSGTQWMYEDADGKQVLTNVGAQINAGNTVNIFYDWTKTGAIKSNRTDVSASGNSTVNIVNSITSTGVIEAYATGARFDGIKTYSDAILTVKKDVWVKDGYFCINGFGLRAGTFQSGSLDVQGQIKLSSVAGTTTTLCLGRYGSRSEAIYGGDVGPLVSVAVGYVLDSSNNKVALDVSDSTNSKALWLNVGAHDNDYDTASLDSPDVLFNGIIKGSDVLAGRTFIYGFSRGNVKAGTEVISCQGISGFLGIKNHATPTDASATNIQKMTILLKNEAGKSYTMLYELADNYSKTDNWYFADYVKTAVVMDGAGTQIINANQKFSGGITVKQGTLLVSGIAIGSDDTTYTHGVLDMQGGTFGFSTQTVKGVYTFNDASMKDSTLNFGVYDGGVDQLQILKVGDSDGALINGNGSGGKSVTVKLLFEGTDSDFISQLVDKEALLITWNDCEDSVNFSADNKTVFGNEYVANFRKDVTTGLYVQFTQVVPEPATYALLIGVLAIVFVTYRRKI